MNIIFIDWDSFCSSDVCIALQHLGHKIYIANLTEQATLQPIDEEFIASLKKNIKEEHCEAVISMNYFPSISIACEEMHCPYISWIYSNPQLFSYDKTITNTCNRIYTFDSYMVGQMRKKGIETFHYAPLAANVTRLTKKTLTQADYEQYHCDISFVGSLYNEKNDFYNTLLSRAKSPYLQGYLEALLAAQQSVFGYNFIAECLTPDILSVIQKHMPQKPTDDSFLKPDDMYADFFLAKRLATMDRISILHMLGNFFDVHLYTHLKSPLTNITHHGKIDYYTDMPSLFRIAKINLNCTKRSIKNGIPLRAIDIMGCGGFLLSNFQEDFLQHFEPDVHLCMYASLEEALDKCRFYLAHEEERKKIMENALDIMKKEHTFEVRLTQMLERV